MRWFRWKKRKTGLALSSGVARGLAHIGVIKALKEKRISVDIIAGSSMGALVGACYARKANIADLEEVVLKTDWKQLVRLVDPNLTLPFKGIIHGKKVKEFLLGLLGEIEFKDLKIPLAVVACDIDRGEEVIIKEGSVVEAVQASISIPAIFMPVKLEGRFLMDGGIVNPVPISVARAMGANFVIACNVIHKPHRRDPFSAIKKQRHLDKNIREEDFPNVFDALIQAIYTMEYEVARLKIKEANAVISPDIGHIAAFEFHRGKEAILAGYNAAKQIKLC